MLWRKVILSESKSRYLWLATAMLFSLHCEPGTDDYPSIGEGQSPDSLSGIRCPQREDGCEDVVQEGGDPSVVPERSRVSCPGHKTNDSFPDSYADFCNLMVTAELLATGDSCFFAPEPEEAGCFCKICA